MKSKTHIYMANMMLDEIKNFDSLTLENIGNFSVPEDIKQAIISQPSAFRAGAIGPDFYPDMIIGQSIIHPEHSGKWLEIMQEQLKTIDKSSKEWAPSYAFYLGYLLHYAGDMFGHDYVNKWAHGSFPSITETITDVEKAKIVTRHILVETYMDKFVPKDTDMTIKAPTSFLYKCFVSDKILSLYPEEFDKINILKMMINLKNKVHKSSQSQIFSILNMFNYFSSWEKDISNAINAWLDLWNQIAIDCLNEDTISNVEEHIKKWANDWVPLLTFIPKWSITFVKYISSIIDYLNLLEPIKKYIKNQLKDMLKNLVYSATGINEEDINQIIQTIINMLKNPALYLDNGKLYSEKNITEKLKLDFGNYGVERNPAKQNFKAYNQCLNMCRMCLLGADSLNAILKPYLPNETIFSKQKIVGSISSLNIIVKTFNKFNITNNNVYFSIILKNDEVLELILNKPKTIDYKQNIYVYTFDLTNPISYSDLKGLRLGKSFIPMFDNFELQYFKVVDLTNNKIIYQKDTNMLIEQTKVYNFDIDKQVINQEFSADCLVMSHLYSLDGTPLEPDYKPWNEPSFFLNKNNDIRQKILIPLFKV